MSKILDPEQYNRYELINKAICDKDSDKALELLSTFDNIDINDPEHLKAINKKYCINNCTIDKCKDESCKESILFNAYTYTSTDVMEKLLKLGADPNYHNINNGIECTILQYMIYNQEEINIDIIELLLKYGADPNFAGSNYYNFPIFSPLYCYDLKLIEILLRYGARINIESVDTGYEVLDTIIDNPDFILGNGDDVRYFNLEFRNILKKILDLFIKYNQLKNATIDIDHLFKVFRRSYIGLDDTIKNFVETIKLLEEYGFDIDGKEKFIYDLLSENK